MKPVELIGVNGDRIPLTGDFCVAVDAVFGTTRPRVSYRSGLFGRRVEQISQDTLISQFAVIVKGSTVDAHDINRNRLIDALRSVSSADSSPAIFIVERDDGSRRAQLGFDVGDDSLIRDATVRRSSVPVVLESANRPYWVALEANINESTIGVADGTPWVGEMPLGGTAGTPKTPIGWPWSIGGYYIADANASEFNLPNDGALPTWPEWQIEGPATSVELAHERTGLVTRWAGTLATGETLKLVTDPIGRSVTIDAVNAWSGVDETSVMSPLLTGNNRVQVGVAGGTAGTTTVKVTSYARYTSA